MARGFGTVQGSASTDSITTSLTTHATERTYAAWVKRDDETFSNRIFAKNTGTGLSVLLFHEEINNQYRFNHVWSANQGMWSISDTPLTGTWFHIAVTYDSSSTSNDPVMYINGSSVTVTEEDTPAGTLTTNADAFVIGNRTSDNNRGWEGDIAEFAIWDRILSAAEIAGLGAGYSPAFYQNSQVLHCPLIRDVIDLKNSAALTVSGGAVQPHPPVIYPAPPPPQGKPSSYPAATTTTWTVDIDLTSDGDFADAGEDITDNVITANWQLGFTQPYETISRAATCNLILNNSSKEYSPENTGSSIYPNFTIGKVLRIRSRYSAVSRTHFIGRIESIQPSGNTKGDRRANVYAVGFMQRAMDAEVFIPVQENKTADQVIEEILTRSALYPPGVSGRWLLGVTNFSELGTNTTLGGIRDMLTAEVGQSSFAVIGDQWDEQTSVYGALRDVTGREGGRLYVDRTGVINFWNRHHLPTDSTSDVTIAETSIKAMQYSYGDGIVNNVIVTAQPRTIESAYTTVATLDKAVKINGDSDKTINFRYNASEDGAHIAGRNILKPLGTIDFTANESETGAGIDRTAFVTATVIDETATRARIKFTNGGPFDAWLQSGATVRGQKITDYGEIDMEVEDSDSIASYRRRKFTYPFIMDDADTALNMADYLLDLWKDPAGRVQSITLPIYKDRTNITQALSRTIGDRITLAETQTGLSADYFIIGEMWQIVAKNNIDVTWLLEPADPQKYWILGVTSFTELGQNTTIGPF